jgi:branched-chain amino acid transport system substrate-binding protein
MRSARLAAAMVAIALIAASCGSSGDDETTASDDTTQSTDTESTDTDSTDGSDTSDDGDGSMADGEMGIDDDNILIGPSGFTIDLNECPSDWSDTEGLTDDAINLGTSFVLSGPAAGFGPYIYGTEAYLKHINDSEGGVGGRTINLEIKDDAYDASRAVTNIQELIQKDKVFAVTAPVGTPANLANYDYINESCVPHFPVVTGHPAWGDPENHPWSVSPAILAYNTEAQLWGQYLLDTWEGEFPITVAALVGNNDFGLAYKEAFAEFIEANPGKIEVVAEQQHEFTAPNITNELTTLAGSEADVVIIMSGAVYCTQMFDGVAQAAWDPVVKIAPGVCSSIVQFFEPAGANGDGWVIVTAEKDINNPDLVGSDEGVDMLRSILEEQGHDPGDSQAGRGFGAGIVIADSLKRAEEMPGGLSRTNYILAARSLDIESHPLLLGDAGMHLDGNEDAFLIETAQVVEYQVPEGETSGSFIPVGELISIEGQTPNCAFVNGSCS